MSAYIAKQPFKKTHHHTSPISKPIKLPTFNHPPTKEDQMSVDDQSTLGTVGNSYTRVPSCECGGKVSHKIATTSANPGRAFFSCSFCGAFRWEDQHDPSKPMKQRNKPSAPASVTVFPSPPGGAWCKRTVPESEVNPSLINKPEAQQGAITYNALRSLAADVRRIARALEFMADSIAKDTQTTVLSEQGAVEDSFWEDSSKEGGEIAETHTVSQ